MKLNSIDSNAWEPGHVTCASNIGCNKLVMNGMTKSIKSNSLNHI